MKFLGIDLGWSSGASGLCCLDWRASRLELIDLRREDDTAAILAWVDTCIAPDESGMIAVDAPTLIPNATGMRLCDRLTHKHFGRYHAGAYPANLGLPFAARTVAFGLSLEAKGFHHAPAIVPKQAGRHQIEVFPHPAIVHLFGLERILKYKKGKLADRRVELARLQQYLCDQLPTLEPALDVSNVLLTEMPLKGAALKALEDQLDSLICAYVAAHWWYWGLERNIALGNIAEGYIIVPNLVTAS
ncbi:MAG: DUF429 domain-containing protein [Stenomitos frigidus ULC029]